MPPLPREICDSEDEDDVVLPVEGGSGHRVAKLSRGEVASAAHVEHVDQQHQLNPSVQHSSDSTGELLRKAHLDLMAPTPNTTDPVAPAHLETVSVNRAKRRLTGADDATPPRVTMGKLKRIRTTPPTIVSQDPSEATIPGATIPGATIPYHDDFCGTNDTVPGSAIEVASVPNQQVPSTRARRSSDQHTLSEEQSSNLTPWSVSAIGSSGVVGNSHRNISSDPPRSDDHLIGLPKEHYNPRPTRSRSEKVPEIPNDYSARPEKAAKAKRAKTIDHPPASSDSINVSSNSFPSYSNLQAPEFEALSPPPPGLAHKKSNSVCELSLDGHSQPTRPDLSSEAASGARAKKGAKAKKEPKSRSQPGKRGRPRKNPLPVPEDEPDELAHEGEMTQTSTRRTAKDDVQVVISPRDSAPALHDIEASGAHDVKSILDALDQRFPKQFLDPPPVEEETTAREQSKKHWEEEEEEDKENESISRVPSLQNKTASVLHKPSTPRAEDVPSKEAERSVGSANEPSEPPAASTAAVLPKKPTNVAARRSPLSWNSKGSSMHRVGLSRTQRTQSLLKVVKGPRS